MPVVGYGSVERTYIQAVSKVIGNIGESAPATLANPTPRITVAMAAVEDARDEVYYHTKWAFRRGFFDLVLVDKQMWYEHPVDLQDMASVVSMNQKDHVISYVEYEKMMALYPDLRSFPPGSGVGGISSATQLIAQTENFGQAKVYTTWGGYIGLMPIPDAAFVALEIRLYASYWRQAPGLATDNDDLGLPRNLWGAASMLALGNLKKALEFSDWETDKAEGVRQLRRESAGKKDSQDTDVYHNPAINYNE